MTKSYNELLEEGQRFVDFLQGQQIDAVVDMMSFRDYNVRIKLLNTSVILYHKPSKSTFSIGVHEIKNIDLANHIQLLWHEFQGAETFDGLCAYVDGSFLNNKIGWGAVFVLDNHIVDQQNGRVPLSPEEGARQIAGEVYAVLASIEYAKVHHYKHITICYDYKGLEMWATQKWKANSPIAQYYVAKMMQYNIKITWHKIPAHTGHIFNEKADQLAKEATSF